MRNKICLIGIIPALALLLVACADDSSNKKSSGGHAIVSSGTFDTPDGATAAGVAAPGDSYSFSFTAVQGEMLTFATMYVQSNDLFYGPGAAGIDLYDAAGNPVTGNITSLVELWDAGTEVNQKPGSGSNQAPRQSGPNIGTDESGPVQLVANSGDGFTYSATTSNLRVTLSHNGTKFTVTLQVRAASDTPLAPGVYAVFTGSGPLFTEGAVDRGLGLEDLAEDGDPSVLAANL